MAAEVDRVLFLTRLRERKVGQWTFGYAAFAWGSLQLLDFIAAHFGWPPWVVRAFTVFLIVNVLTAVVLAWYHGIAGRQRIAASETALLGIVLAIATGGAFVAARATPHDTSTVVDAPTSVQHAAPVSEASVAVLPFVNIGNPDQEYFSDGITEEILNAVGRIPGVQVAARTSAFAFKGRNDDVKLIASKLRVASVVEGTVRREGGHIRVSARLTSASTGYQVWSKTYDSDARDIFAIEDDISRAIAKELQATLGAQTVLAGQATANERAHELYLLGMDSWTRRTPESVPKSVLYFTRALAADSMYPDAHAGLALALSILPDYDHTANARAIYARGKVAARRALALNPGSAPAYAALGEIADYEDDTAAGEQFEKKALELDPNYATAHKWLAETQWLRGDLKGSLREMDRAVTLDPLSPLMFTFRGFVRAADGDINGGMADIRAALTLDPAFSRAVSGGMSIGIAARQYDFAREMILKSTSSFLADTIIDGLRDPTRRVALVRFIHSDPTRMSMMKVMLAQLIGEHDFAIQLARADEARGVPGSAYWWASITMPAMKPLRDDPRFPARFTWPRK